MGVVRIAATPWQRIKLRRCFPFASDGSGSLAFFNSTDERQRDPLPPASFPHLACHRSLQMAPPHADAVPKLPEAGLVVGLSTASSKEEAKKVAEHLVRRKLAACVQMVPGVESVYEWKGTLETSSEVLLIIKTQRHLTQDVVQAIKENHGYEVPEMQPMRFCIVCQVVFTDVVDGNVDYIKWAREATQPKAS
ncbi:hypothetical protein Emed_003861 [Eimeria media]